jgi:hypothetical protein
MTMQAPIADEHLADSPGTIDLATIEAAPNDTACPLCHGDELRRPSCQLCATAADRAADPRSELRDIAIATAVNPCAEAVGLPLLEPLQSCRQ